jgi:hypothetical protein
MFACAIAEQPLLACLQKVIRCIRPPHDGRGNANATSPFDASKSVNASLHVGAHREAKLGKS